ERLGDIRHRRAGAAGCVGGRSCFRAVELATEATSSDARDGKPGIGPSLALISGADIRPERVNWVWVGWLARGKLHIVAGAPGTGKTTLAIALGATLTIGGKWPDGTAAPAGDVVVWSGEDDPADTLLPRFIAAGGDPARLHFVSDVTDREGRRPFSPAADMPLLSKAMNGLKRPPALLIVDPVVSAVAGDSHKNAEVRRALQPLVDLAQRHKCAVLGISHFSKGTSGRDPVERVTGSLGFGALARVVMATAKRSDEDGGGRLLAKAKSNLGPDDGGFVYELEPCEPISGIQTTRVLWGEALAGSARELLASAESVADPEDQSAMADAKGFLRMLLEDGPVPSKSVRAEAEGAGHSWSTIRRAKDQIGAVVVKEGGRFGGTKQQWVWKLDAEDAQGAHKMPITNGGHLQVSVSTFSDSSPNSEPGDIGEDII
ncbi:AAA family ATPase, partial [uncultured Thiohalocapsa sp.]|uniref:AAA family ATPase n=1 Tax=uncultured Thiohalocapsa sp. TaxID=768990 RepID=UPI0025E35382